jgi:serine/threonine protein kinase
VDGVRANATDPPAAIQPPAPQPPGAPYALERELGRGGMATAYLAHDAKHGRRVAGKVLPLTGWSLARGIDVRKRQVTSAFATPRPGSMTAAERREAP